MSSRLSRLESVLEDSGVAAMLEAAIPTAGPPRQLGTHSVLVGILLSISTAKVAHLASAYRALCDLPIPDQIRLGVARHSRNGLKIATYRQFEHSFSQMMAPVDPSPVPSFRGVAPTGRAQYLAERRKGIESACKQAMLFALTDALLEASIPEKDRSRRCLAVDWTDHETWARPKDKAGCQLSADPDAAWRHAKRNAPGAKDGLFFGYYAQVAVMAPEEGSKGDSEFICRVVLKSASVEPADEMAGLLERMAGTGAGPSDVLADCGYSFKTGFSSRLRRIGADPVMDLHPFDRGPKGTFEGAVCANGSLYCPAVPEPLLSLGPLVRGASAQVVEAHDRSCAELEHYRFAPLNRPDRDGYERVMCPASAGKLRCPLVETSLTLSFSRPSIAKPPLLAPRCCRQASITVPPNVNDKTRQKHPYPSPTHRRSYARRTAAERAYARLADPAGEGVRRGWCRLFGTAKNALMYSLAAVAHNIRISESRERQDRAEARRAAYGTSGHSGRHRRHDPGPPSEAPVSDDPAVPG
jgi:hypothetical protein